MKCLKALSEEEKKHAIKGKGTGQMSSQIDFKSSLSKGWQSGLARDKSAKPSESSSPDKDLKGTETNLVGSTTLVYPASKVNLVSKPRSRRKNNLQRAVVPIEGLEKISRKRTDKHSMRLPEKALSWKVCFIFCIFWLKVLHCWFTSRGIIFLWSYSGSIFRTNSLAAYLCLLHEGGASVNGFTVLLIILGLPKGSLLII